MESSFWNFSSLIMKLFIYAGFANAVAIPAVIKMANFDQSSLKKLKSLLSKTTVLALLATVGYFFIQVGYMSETGPKGMFDQFMIKLVWASSIGESTTFRLIAFAFVYVLTIGIKQNYLTKLPWFSWARNLLYFVVLSLIGLSFSTSGHVSELSILAKISIGIHVLIAFWWTGSFYPLLQSCHQLSVEDLSILMHKFGQMASFFVAVLIVLGTYLAIELVGGFEQLTGSSYGRLLIVKLLLVIHILMLAAFHKFIVVPSLIKKKESKKSLIASIKVEMTIGVAVLLITGILTTLLGPGHHG